MWVLYHGIKSLQICFVSSVQNCSILSTIPMCEECFLFSCLPANLRICKFLSFLETPYVRENKFFFIPNFASRDPYYLVWKWSRYAPQSWLSLNTNYWVLSFLTGDEKTPSSEVQGISTQTDLTASSSTTSTASNSSSINPGRPRSRTKRQSSSGSATSETTPPESPENNKKWGTKTV